jgi:hypothetical protein
MKLSELMEASSELGPQEHAFWQHTRGPNNTPGASLHYIQDEEAWGKHILADATEKGEERRIKNIQQSYERGQYDKGKFSHPSFDWWMSIEAFEKGDKGFGGMTKERVMKENPKLKIHDSRDKAVKAAGFSY